MGLTCYHSVVSFFLRDILPLLSPHYTVRQTNNRGDDAIEILYVKGRVVIYAIMARIRDRRFDICSGSRPLGAFKIDRVLTRQSLPIR